MTAPHSYGEFPKQRQLGAPLPNSTHAISVSMPDWQDVVGYEEGDARVIHALQSGYPRFFYHPSVAALINTLRTQYCAAGEDCLPVPSQKAAETYIAFLASDACRAHHDTRGIYVVTFPESLAKTAKACWQHSGYIISSRHADDLLSATTAAPPDDVMQAMRVQLAQLNPQQAPDDVYLYVSGMNAFFHAYRTVCARTPGAANVQLGFPYVDAMKVQEKFGNPSYLLPCANNDDIYQLEALLAREPIAGIFCEITGNPELKTVDVPAISALARRYGVPFIIDDTVSAWQTDITPYADMIVTSLSKFYSGAGDVIAGALTLNRTAPLYADLSPSVQRTYENLLYPADARILHDNAQDITQRLDRINTTAAAVADALQADARVAGVLYPAYTARSEYNAIKRADGGYGGMFSIIIDSEEKAARFFDALTLCKGPGLGNNFTLICPYILLAHYYELDMVRAKGIAPHLVRCSIGLEPAEEIIADMTRALDTAG